MPIYMDRHYVPGLTAIEAAEGHKRDMEVQHKYGCRAFTYWFDGERESGFCLIEAPNKEAVKRMHDEAHGLVPNQIIEVNSSIVEAFLGRIKDPEAKDEAELIQLIGPAFRVIMSTEFKDASLIKSKMGESEGSELLRTCSELIENAIERHQGREVEYATNSIMASFVSANKSAECAMDIHKYFRNQHRQISCAQLNVAIGLSAGDPVTDNEEFFGDAIPFAKRLSHITCGGHILISSLVRDQLRKERSRFFLEEKVIKTLNPQEEKFINCLMDVIEKAWNQEGFNVGCLGKQMALSKAQLYRKTIALTNWSPTEFIREFRLKKATELIEKQWGNISEIAYETGFGSPSYFSKCFQKRFGILPSEYLKCIS